MPSATGAARRPLRCVAVGLHLDPDRARSTEALVASVDDLLDRALPRDSEVDTGVATGVSTEVATLVALPEHTGLLAMLVGERGTAARDRWREGGSTLDILFALAGGYGEVLARLAQRHPEVASAGQLLHLACTDTVVRTLVEGLGRLAAQRGIWLSVGAALPRWTYVPVDPGSGSGDGDPELTALLAGPEGADRSHVAVPTGPAVRNRQLLLAPSGELAVVHDKVSLVPVEADGEGGLGLEPATLAEVRVADLPIGRVATVISKDAWMPDVNERLDQLGAQILLQPEAFDRWGEPDVDAATGRRDLWPPDKFQRGGWWMLQRHPGFRVNLAPMLVGALGELSFDGQPVIAVPSPGGAPDLALLGQPPDTGWAAVGTWWRAAGVDGSRATRGTSGSTAGADRAQHAGIRCAASGAADAPPPTGRRDTVAVARVVLPGSGPAAAYPTVGRGGDSPGHRGGGVPRHPGGGVPGHRGGGVPRHPGGGVPRHPEVSDSIEVEEAVGAVQLVPDLATGQERAWLAWVACDDAGRQQLRLTAGDGRRWGPSGALSPAPQPQHAGGDPVAARRWRPRLAVDGTGPICLHLGFPAGSWDLFAVRPWGNAGAPPRVDDADTDHGVLRERLHDAPAIITDGAGLVAVWSDLRWPWVLPQVRLARSGDGGATWSASARVDGGARVGEEDPLAGRSPAETRGQTAPSVAVCDGEVVVAWQERDTDGVPSIRLAWPESDQQQRPVRTLARAMAEEPVPSDGAQEVTPPRMRLARPVVAASGRTLWAVWEAWHLDGGAGLWAVVSRDGGHYWCPPQPLDPSRPAGAHQHRAGIVPLGCDRAVVVLVDDRSGSSSVVATTVDITRDATGADRLRSTASLRLDDAPTGAHARAPTAARLGDALLVAWQDTRAGTELLRSARLPLQQ